MAQQSLDRSLDQPALERARALARVLDTAIAVPGTRVRIGLDPIIGLVPGVGDLAGVLLSASILLSAAQLGVSGPVLVRMGANIGLEAVIGTIPLLGDLFDAGWRANTRNVRLMEAHLADPAHSARAGTRWLLLTVAAIVAVLLVLLGAAAWILFRIARLVGIM